MLSPAHLDIEIFMLCHCLYSCRHFSSDTVYPSIKPLLCGRSNCAFCLSLLTSTVSQQVTINKSPNFHNHMHWHLLLDSLMLDGLDYGLWLIIFSHQMSFPEVSVLVREICKFCSHVDSGKFGNYFEKGLDVLDTIKSQSNLIFRTSVSIWKQT